MRYEKADAISCRRCGCGQSKVSHTIINEVTFHGVKRVIIKRRRVCRHCAFAYTTVETYEEDIILADTKLAQFEAESAEKSTKPEKSSRRIAARSRSSPKEKPPPKGRKRNPFRRD